MTSSLDLLHLVHAAIVAGDTDAGEDIFKPGDWPTQNDQYPIIKMRLAGEERTSLGRGGGPQFLTIALIRLSLEASAPAKVDDLGASDVETSLWTLKRQVEVAMINSAALDREIQQIASIRAQLAFTSEAATHLGGLQMDVALEFYEGAENFAPIESDDLDEAGIELAGYPPLGLEIPFPED